MGDDTYEIFKVIYCALLAIIGAVLLMVLTATMPFATLALASVLMLAGGIYIIRREGWLSTHNGDGE